MSKKALSIVFFVLSVAICEGAGFNSPRQILLPTAQRAIASGDLNGDGSPDLIIGGDPVSSEPGKIRVLLGKGNGNFHPPQNYSVGFIPDQFPARFIKQIITGDLNEDGHLDVVVAHNGEPTQFGNSDLLVTVLFGDGQGNLQSSKVYLFFDGQSKAVMGIDFADFNRDGKMDIVVGCESGFFGIIFGLINLGNENFQTTGPKVIGTPIIKMQSAFSNNDSNPDLVMTTREGTLILYGNGTFYSNEGQVLDKNIVEIGLVVRDFNADGKPDIAVTEQFNPLIRIFLSSALGYPTNPIVYQTNFLSDLMVSNDFNADGKFDLLIVDGLGGTFQIFYGTGDGNFYNPEIVNNTLPVSDLTTADFDLNGKIDIAASLLADQPAKQAAIFLNAPNPSRYHPDFDGDGRADVSVFRPTGGVWYINQSSNGLSALSFGLSTDQLVPADYDGDGKTDIAVYRSGTWYLQRSSQGFTGLSFGDANDIPIPADYDGDGHADIAIFRPSNGVWYLLQSSEGFVGIAFGQTGDKPVPADYDGDGKTDIAVNRSGIWYLLRSQLGFTGIAFGEATDKLVPADYDGDGKSDIAVYRAGVWYLLQSTAGFAGTAFGLGTDLPVPADYDGDGKTDVSVFRDGTWYLNRSTAGFTGIAFGASTDEPVPNAFIP